MTLKDDTILKRSIALPNVDGLIRLISQLTKKRKRLSWLAARDQQIAVLAGVVAVVPSAVANALVIVGRIKSIYRLLTLIS